MRSLIPFPWRREESEWVGGRYRAPNKVQEGGVWLEPDVIVWLELPAGVIVGSKVVDPREPVAFADTLKEAMAHPAHGSPRQPARIRMPELELAQALREAIGSEIPVSVDPVPELAELAATLVPHGPSASYLAGKAISPAVVAPILHSGGDPLPYGALADRRGKPDGRAEP